MITINEIETAQQDWVSAVIRIGQLKDDSAGCRAAAEQAVDSLYAFETTDVLFKPTKASLEPFRHTRQGALSYFIGGDSDFPEDGGFALRPWRAVQFKNSGFRIDGHNAAAMGHYIFTDEVGDNLTVEYSFGYFKDSEGRLRIWLHHSSLPYRTL